MTKLRISLSGLLLAAAALATLAVAAPAARAQNLTDPLHGFCNGNSPAGTCIDNGTNTPLGNSTSFGFTISPGPQTGDLTLVVLVPSNDVFAGGSITETSPTSKTVALSQHSGTWTSGDLASFLSIDAAPNNPIGAYLPTTQQFDPTAGGYTVFTADMGITTIDKNGGTSPSFNIISGLPLGSYIVGFCAGSAAGGDCTTGGPSSTTEVATANSGALLVNGNIPPGVPEPSSLVLLGAALVGMGMLGRRRLKIT